MEDKADEGKRGSIASTFLAVAGDNLTDAAREAMSGAGAPAALRLAEEGEATAIVPLSAAARERLGSSAARILGQSKRLDSLSGFGALAIPSETLGASRIRQLGSTMAAALKGYNVSDVSGLAAAMKPLYEAIDTRKLLGTTTMTSLLGESLGSVNALAELGKSTLLNEVAAKPSYLESLTGMKSMLSQASEAAALRDEQFARLVEPLHGVFKNVDLLSGTAFSNYNFMDWVNRPAPVLVPLEDPVDEWLQSHRPDLVSKRDGMWFAVTESPDPVNHACTSAAELLKHLFLACGITDKAVIVWAKTTKHYEEAVDITQGTPRVTWRGRLRMAASVAGFDEVGQELAASFADGPRLIQKMKHEAHLYTATQVEVQLHIVEEILNLFAGRL